MNQISDRSSLYDVRGNTQYPRVHKNSTYSWRNFLLPFAMASSFGSQTNRVVRNDQSSSKAFSFYTQHCPPVTYLRRRAFDVKFNRKLGLRNYFITLGFFCESSFQVHSGRRLTGNSIDRTGIEKSRSDWFDALKKHRVSVTKLKSTRTQLCAKESSICRRLAKKICVCFHRRYLTLEQ